MSFDIMDAQSTHRSDWLLLWQEYLRFYRVTLAEGITENTWTQILEPRSPMRMRVGVMDGHVVAFAIHQLQQSTWAMEPVGYLEDLFMSEEFRGKGFGRKMLDDFISIARSSGCKDVFWHTRRDNQTARSLYDTYAQEDGNVRYTVKV